MDTELEAVLHGVFDGLEAGARNGHGFHVPVLGTASADGRPDQRMVVLRAFDRETRQLYVNTDRRSPKVAAIANEPRVSWLFYDPATKTQVRIQGVAAVHCDDAIADARWQRAALRARRCYLGRPPGERSDVATTGLPDELATREPTDAESAPGRANFAVIRSTIDSIDWLELAFTGHRRASFRWEGSPTPSATWRAP